MTATLADGGCLCGAIRYRARGDPTDVTLCHCRTCRKAAGAPLVAWVTFPASDFTIVTGTPARYPSSPKVVRTFCGTCGTPLTYAHADFPSGIDVTVCSLDEPERFPPADHTWVDHRVGWLRANEDLPAYGGRRPT
jgi:hypothetical protein